MRAGVEPIEESPNVPFLRLTNVTKRFGSGWLSRRAGLEAVSSVSLSVDINSPSILAIAGESGSGKTTLARLLLGSLKPTEGSVFYRGRDARKMPGGVWRSFRREVQAVFQDPFEAFNPFYHVDHVLELPLHCFGIAQNRTDRDQRILAALQQVGLRPDETLGRYSHQLSGGQRQRLMIARALLMDPKLIVADEPVSMVDASLRANILSTLQRLNRENRISIIYITHDLTTAFQISHNIAVMYRGAVVEYGDVESVIKDPQHPYTRQLIEAIPTPDPTTPWEYTGTIADTDRTTIEGTPACRFADRCPHAMPECRTQVPGTFRTGAQRAVKCFLYRDREPVETPDLADVFAQSGTVSPA